MPSKTIKAMAKNKEIPVKKAEGKWQQAKKTCRKRKGSLSFEEFYKENINGN